MAAALCLFSGWALPRARQLGPRGENRVERVLKTKPLQWNSGHHGEKTLIDPRFAFRGDRNFWRGEKEREIDARSRGSHRDRYLGRGRARSRERHGDLIRICPGAIHVFTRLPPLARSTHTSSSHSSQLMSPELGPELVLLAMSINFF